MADVYQLDGAFDYRVGVSSEVAGDEAELTEFIDAQICFPQQCLPHCAQEGGLTGVVRSG